MSDSNGPFADRRDIEHSARRGARTASRRLQLVEDAVELTMARWDMRTLAGPPVHDACAWAFRVGANVAKQLGERTSSGGSPQSRCTPVSLPPEPGSPESPEELSLPSNGHGVVRTDMREIILDHCDRLTRKQMAVLLMFSQPGMTIRGAAKLVDKDHSGLRRLYRRALHALEHAIHVPLPPPTGADR